VLPMGHDPLGLAWSRMPMRSHAGVNVREQEPSQLRGHCTHPSWPKAPCVEPTGEMERAATAMHDAIGHRAQAHKVASVGPRRRHGRETESGGHEFGSPLHKASRGWKEKALGSLEGNCCVWAMSPIRRSSARKISQSCGTINTKIITHLGRRRPD
jgi:hypothetical protein